MTVLMVRYEVRKEHVADLDAGVQQLVTVLEEEQPEGVRYALCMLPDGVTVVGFLELEEGVDNPLPALAAARTFQENLRNWVVEDPSPPQPLDVLGSYGLFIGEGL